MTRVRVLADRRSGNPSHSFGHVKLHHHHGNILVPLPTGVLRDVEILGLCDVILLARYDPVLCLLAVRRTQKIDGPLYDGNIRLFWLPVYSQVGSRFSAVISQ